VFFCLSFETQIAKEKLLFQGEFLIVYVPDSDMLLMLMNRTFELKEIWRSHHPFSRIQISRCDIHMRGKEIIIFSGHPFEETAQKKNSFTIGHFRIAFFSWSKRVFVQNHSYENVFRLQVRFHSNQTHFHLKNHLKSFVASMHVLSQPQSSRKHAINLEPCLKRTEDA